MTTSPGAPHADVEVDVVVVSYRSARHLPGAVTELSAVPGVRVLVVDNNAGDGSAESVSHLPVDVIDAGGNVGFARGCNLGIAAGSAPAVLLLNPDARIDPASLRLMLDVLLADPTLAAVVPTILGADGHRHPSLRLDPSPRRAASLAVGAHRFARGSWADEVIRDPAAYVRAHDVEWASGACQLLRRTALDAVGGLCEDYWMYCEDADLGRSFRAAGWRTRFVPEAVAQHVGGASASRATMAAAHATARVRYAQRWEPRPAALAVRAAVALRELREALTADDSSASRGHLTAARAAGRRPQPVA